MPGAEGKCLGIKRTSNTSTTSKCHQITSPGSVFFQGCYTAKAGNADKGLVESTYYLLRNTGSAPAPITKSGVVLTSGENGFLKGLWISSQSLLPFLKTYSELLPHSIVKTFLSVEDSGCSSHH